MNEKNLVLVTGGYSGIGAAITESLAARGYRVGILGRNREKGDLFLKAAKTKGLHSIEFFEANLDSIHSIMDTAERIRRECPGFSVFIHNAGMWPVQRVLNSDGLEQSFVTNHLAPFLLNLLLEDLYTKNRSRIVQVTAGLYVAGMKEIEPTPTGENFSLLKTYATTKLFNLIGTMKFAERWEGTGISINAVHPGIVRTGLGNMDGFLGIVLKVMKMFWLTPEKGAEAPVMLADDPSFENVSGKYYHRFKEQPLQNIAQDQDFNEAVWQQAMALVDRV